MFKKITGTFGFFLQPRWVGQSPVDLLRMLIKKGQAGSPVTGWLMTHHWSGAINYPSPHMVMSESVCFWSEDTMEELLLISSPLLEKQMETHILLDI